MARQAAASMEEPGSRRRERMRAILVEAALRLFAKQGVDAIASASPDEFAAFLRDDFVQMVKLVRETGIRAGE